MIYQKSIVILAALTLTLQFPAAQQVMAQPPVNLGVNLDDGGAFVNVINHTNRYNNAKGYDAHGWPTSNFDMVLFDGRPATEWTGTIDDPEAYRVDYSGRYKSSFAGSATVRATGTSVTIENVAYDSLTNTTLFDVVVGGYPNANHGMVFLNFSNTRRSPADTLNSGITTLRVLRPGYDRTTTKTFTDEYIRLCQSAPFRCYRFYNVENIWDGEPVYPAKTTWLQRKTPLDASQHSMSLMNSKRDGWCWEYVIELANILKKDVWINIHMSCDSDYVANLARTLNAELNPAINIYIENSNEVWSPTQATHGPYNQAEATQQGISFDQNYARRVVELSNWFALVFGKAAINNRIRVILSGQQAYAGRSDVHLNYIKQTFGDPKDFIYATSAALYFGSTKATDTDPLRINDGMLEDIAAQIGDSNVSSSRSNHIHRAAQWGLVGGCTSYEGGPGVPSGGGTMNLANQINAHRTQKMGEAIKFNYGTAWRQLGGGLALYFTLTSAYNRYGCWGITDDYTVPNRNFKLTAVRELLGGAAPVKGTTASIGADFDVAFDDAASSLNIITPNALRVEHIRLYNCLGVPLAESHGSQAVMMPMRNGVFVVHVSFAGGVAANKVCVVTSGMVMPSKSLMQTR